MKHYIVNAGRKNHIWHPDTVEQVADVNYDTWMHKQDCDEVLYQTQIDNDGSIYAWTIVLIDD